MDSVEKKILIFGAGKIGRGFIADLFYRADYHLIFVDANRELIENLRSKGEYALLNMQDADEKEEIIIKNYEAFHIGEKEQIATRLMECSILATAVFPDDFEQVVKEIAGVIEQRALKNIDEPLDIIICANIFHPSARFRKLFEASLSEAGKRYFKRNIGLVDSIVIRMGVDPTLEMKRKDPLLVLTNGYPELIVNKKGFKGRLPVVNGLVFSENIAAEETRKIYTYNMLHVVYAYLGHRRGYKYIIECSSDDDIQEIAVETLKEASEGLQREYGFSEGEMDTWNKRVLKNMANPILMDRVDRVGADPVRKLRREDRLIGPALLCRRNGIMPYYLAKATAYAFLYNNPEDKFSVEISKYLKKKSITDAVRYYCQLEYELELVYMIAEHYNRAVNGASMKEDIERVKILKKAYELGFMYEKTYKGCAQCTIAPFFKLTRKVDKALFQCASGLSGGIAITGDGSCGGYTGGVIYMSSYIGRRLDRIPIDGDKVAQYKSYEMAQKLHDRFIEAYGSVTCSDIQKKTFGKSYCLRTKEARDEFETAGGHRDKCTTVIAIACAWIADIMLDEKLIKR